MDLSLANALLQGTEYHDDHLFQGPAPKIRKTSYFVIRHLFLHRLAILHLFAWTMSLEQITSGDIFSARTLETRFVLHEVNQRWKNPKCPPSVPNRNLIRRGRSHWPKRPPKKRKRGGKQQASHHHNGDGIDHNPTVMLRYQKRRPSLLIQEKTKHLHSGWLHTHLWHAKRCRMGTLWGYKLSLRNMQHSARSMRSTLRQLSSVCTLHDASYWNIIALHGSMTHILDLLLPYIAPFERDLFQSDQLLNGHREIPFHLYHPDRYPLGFVCTVRCSFDAINPAEDDDDDTKNNVSNSSQKRVCWLWCHASVFVAVYQQLKETSSERESRDLSHRVQVRDESRQFVRYEVRGPMSSFVVQAATYSQVPVLMDRNSESIIGDGDCLTSMLWDNPSNLSVAQPFVLGMSQSHSDNVSKTNLNRKRKCLRFQLKHDFILRNSPLEHPSRLKERYKACGFQMSHHFHRYFEHRQCDDDDDDNNTNNEFVFKMVSRRFYDPKDEDLVLGRKIVGWDLIIPIHSAEPRHARLWWNNLHFGGGRVIGLEQKVAMRLEMRSKGRLFPIDDLDSSASIHYWLKHRKYPSLTEYFKRPKSKRAHPFPVYPFSFWPNVLYLMWRNEGDKIKEMLLTMDAVQRNLKEIAKCLETKKRNDKDEGNTDEIEMELKRKEARYKLNYTLLGFKEDSFLMRQISAKLHVDAIEEYGHQWIQDMERQYFIVRDRDLLQRIKRRQPIISSMEEWSGSKWTALVKVNIAMQSKGVPSTGSLLRIDDHLCGIVVDGAYSSIEGKGIGFGLVVLDRLMTLYSETNNSNTVVTMTAFGSFPNHSFQCQIELSI